MESSGHHPPAPDLPTPVGNPGPRPASLPGFPQLRTAATTRVYIGSCYHDLSQENFGGDMKKVRRFTASVEYKDPEGRTQAESFPVTVEDYAAATALAETYVLRV